MEKHFAPEKIFLVFVLFIGLFMVFFIPPFQSQDEPNHFKRAYSVALFKFFPVRNIDSTLGGSLPCALQDFINAASDTGSEVVYAQSGYRYSFSEFKKLLHLKIEKDKQCFLNYPNMAIYSPAAYLPQSAGILAASLFTQKVLFMFLTARIFNLLFFALLCFYAIKTTPYLKWVFVLVLSCPMSLALASSLSADAVLSGCCALFFAKVLEALSSHKTVNGRDILVLAVLGLIIALTKQSFWFLLFIFLIPKDSFKNNYSAALAAVLVPSFCFYVLWSLFASSVMVPLNDSDSASHIAYITAHPLSFCVLVFKTVFNTEVLYQAIGVLGWKSLYLHKLYYAGFLIILFANLFCVENNGLELSWQQRCICILSAVFNVVLICATTFCFWTYKTTFNYIELQGRYLLPFVLPLCAFISSFLQPVSCRYFALINTVFLVFSGLYLAGRILSGYWF